jgi:hypothetical protein
VTRAIISSIKCQNSARSSTQFHDSRNSTKSGWDAPHRGQFIFFPGPDFLPVVVSRDWFRCSVVTTRLRRCAQLTLQRWHGGGCSKRSYSRARGGGRRSGVRSRSRWRREKRRIPSRLILLDDLLSLGGRWWVLLKRLCWRGQTYKFTRVPFIGLSSIP